MISVCRFNPEITNAELEKMNDGMPAMRNAFRTSGFATELLMDELEIRSDLKIIFVQGRIIFAQEASIFQKGTEGPKISKPHARRDYDKRSN